VFLAADDKAHQTFLFRAGAAKPLTAIKGIANTPRFSPDGTRIAILATLGARKKTGAVEAAAAQVGEIGARNDEQRSAILPAAGGTARPVSPADTYLSEYGWTPDGKGFAATAANGKGDNNWWIATLEYIDASGGALRPRAILRQQKRRRSRTGPRQKRAAADAGLGAGRRIAACHGLPLALKEGTMMRQ
jgi:hypothetical protein